MKSILMTTSAVLLVTGLAVGQAGAACPEDIDAFNRQYEKTLQNAAAGEALSTSEQAQLFGLRTAAENMFEAGEVDMCAEVIQRANLILESAVAPQVIKPSDLVGRDVRNAADEDLGEIEDVMLDPVSGRIAYVVVEHGGFLGIGDDLFAVPWRAMKFVPGDDDTAVILDIPEEKLENAPRFSRKDETPLERREWVTSVHNYYGVEPYWQDEVGAMALQYGAGAGAQSTAATGAEPKTEVLIVEPAEGSASDTQAEPQSTESATTPAASSPETKSSSDEQSSSGTQPASEAESATGTKPASETTPSTGTQPATETQPSSDTKSDAGTDTQTQAAAGTESSAEPPAGSANLMAVQPSTASSSSGDMDTLIARVDQLEQDVQDLSEKDVGQEVKDSISSLEQKVEALSQQMPGEEIKQSIDQLEQKVQQLSENGVGDEIRQQIARLEEKVAALGDGSAAEAQSGQPAAVAVVPEQSTGDQQPDQANQQQSDQQSGQQQSEKQETGQQQSGQQQSGSGAQPSDSASQQGEQQEAPQEVVIQGTTTQPATESAESATDSSSQTEAMTGQPCEEQISQLEEDLDRAEKQGVAVDDAQNELDEAQAMLKNSEALCRAAIKRAHEELIAVGFEPTQTN